MDKTTEAFRTILEEINKQNDDDKNDIEQDSNFVPKLIMSDQDSSFLGEKLTISNCLTVLIKWFHIEHNQNITKTRKTQEHNIHKKIELKI